MVLFNHATREMTAKIVYYGPGLCGKTTNLMVIFDKLDPKNRGKMLSLATKTDRTLFFDLLPVDIGRVGAFNLKIQLYTVPGQVFYNETRKLVLKGADSVVFVADSQGSMVESNRESFANLLDNLRENSIDPNDVPIIIQYNKRDIPGVLPVEDLQEKLNFEGYPYVEASAVLGDGVMETFKLASKITAKHLMNRLQGKPSSKTEPVQEKKKGPKKISIKMPVPEEAPASPAASAEPPPFGDTTPPDADAALAANPFGDSMPFAEAPTSEGYEKVEEVSLEELLEGRERPATFGGNVAVPFVEPVADEEVESLDEGQLLAAEPIDLGGPAAEPVEETTIDLSATASDLVSSPEVEQFVPDGQLAARLQILESELERVRSDQERIYRVLSDVAAQLQQLTRQ